MKGTGMFRLCVHAIAGQSCECYNWNVVRQNRFSRWSSEKLATHYIWERCRVKKYSSVSRLPIRFRSYRPYIWASLDFGADLDFVKREHSIGVSYLVKRYREQNFFPTIFSDGSHIMVQLEVCDDFKSQIALLVWFLR